MSGISRVIVGASGSPGSLQALRYAEQLARAHDAILIPVLAWVPPGGELADRRAPNSHLRRVWAEDARQQLWVTLQLAWGEIPTDPPVQPFTQRGEAGWVLVSTASCPGDLLVLGAGRHGGLARMTSGKVRRHCLAHAQCPVLAIPPPPSARDLGHGLTARMHWHRPLSVDELLGDSGTAA
jgi:nucleotide-binding universal stress UspA family protein